MTDDPHNNPADPTDPVGADPTDPANSIDADPVDSTDPTEGGALDPHTDPDHGIDPGSGIDPDHGIDPGPGIDRGAGIGRGPGIDRGPAIDPDPDPGPDPDPSAEPATGPFGSAEPDPLAPSDPVSASTGSPPTGQPAATPPPSNAPPYSATPPPSGPPPGTPPPGAHGAPGAPEVPGAPWPAGAQPAPGQTRLVRDPYSRLGGVASGVAHYYGFDVSLVRLSFVIGSLITGFGFLAYLLAWLIIPRAEYWPPTGPARPIGSMSRRDVGVAMAVVGLLLALAISRGVAGAVLVPVILIGGGIWMLLQPESNGNAPTFPGPAPGVGPQPGSFTPPTPGATATDAPAPSTFAVPVTPGAPVPGRSRRRRFGIVLISAGVLLFVVIPALLIGGAVAVLAGGGVADLHRVPATVGEIPDLLEYGAGDITVDLTELSPSDFDDFGDGLVDMSIDLGFGQIRVIVPEDLDVEVGAEATFGDVRVFDQSSDGIGNSVNTRSEDPDLELDLTVIAGEIVVVRR